MLTDPRTLAALYPIMFYRMKINARTLIVIFIRKSQTRSIPVSTFTTVL